MRYIFTHILILLLLLTKHTSVLQAQHLKWHHVLTHVEVHDFKSDPAGNMYLIGNKTGSGPALINDKVILNEFGGSVGGVFIKITPEGDIGWVKMYARSDRTMNYLQFDDEQNIYNCYFDLRTKDKLVVDKYNPQGKLILSREFILKNPKTDYWLSYQIFLHGFTMHNAQLYFLVYAGQNTSIEGVKLADNTHHLVKADLSGKIEWATKVGLETTSLEKGYLASEPDGNMLVTMNPLSSNNNPYWYRHNSYIYRVSPAGSILLKRSFPEFKRVAAFRAVSISPGGKISVAASVDSQAVINGKIYTGHTLVLMHLNNDLSINKYVTAKGLVIQVTLAIDAEDNFYAFGVSTNYSNGNKIYLPAQDGTTFGDSTINKGADWRWPQKFFVKTDPSGKPGLIKTTGLYLTEGGNDDTRMIKPGWATVNNCKQLYIGAHVGPTLHFDNATIKPKHGPGSFSFLIASIENNADSITTELQPLCNKALACKTTANKGFNKFQWDFGDGKSSTANEPVHLYDTPGTYIVTLRSSTPLGCEKIITDTVFVPDVNKANFTFQNSTGCQWVGFQFKDSSTTDTINAGTGASWRWDFGDGSTDTARNPVHIYTKSGNYTVRLIYSNGFCNDTFTTTQQIHILEAPKPGFMASALTGCVPLQVQLKDNSQGAVVKYHYSFGNGKEDTLASPSVVFDIPGQYKIKQQLLGPTGCITSDSVMVTVYAGIPSQSAPQIQWATVKGTNATELVWQPLSGAADYTIYRKSEKGSGAFAFITQTENTFYHDDVNVSPSEASISYKIVGRDSCGNFSTESHISKTIHLRARNENNLFAVLEWTPYEHWQQGVLNYTIEAFDESSDTSSATSSLQTFTIGGQSTSYHDEDFWQKEKENLCYRINATSAANNLWQSASNTVCLPYLPQIWIPTAFSPNNDGLNDTFRVSCTGIAEMELQIFNRWGERVCTLNSVEDGWDGKYRGELVPAGEYIYVLKAKGVNKENIYTSGSIMRW